MPDATSGGPEVRIATDLMDCTVPGPANRLTIRRIADPEHRLSTEWAKTSRPAPPAVLQPLIPVPGVVPLGELELIAAMQAPDILVVDSRKADQYAKYTLPGAMNLPFTDAEATLEALGCRRTDGGWDCRNAHKVAMFCNGAWCGQSPTAIHRMTEAGFPPDHILYYRNGMQGWLLQGLSVWRPGDSEVFHI